MNLKKIVIKPEKFKVIKSRNSWLYTGAVKYADKNIQEGEIVKITDIDDKILAYGFYFPGRNIISYIFHFSNKEIDVLNKDFWKNKIFNAFEIRKNILPLNTNAYRLVHSEGDNFPGLTIDIYNNVAVIEFRIKGTENLLHFIKEALEDLGFKHIFIKQSYSGNYDNTWLTEKYPQNLIEILEYGNKFLVDIENGQKTGFFLDQRENRNLIKAYSKGKTVLNLFSYTGGFSVYSLSAGAKIVHSVDVSESSISLANENAKLNGFNQYQHIGIVENAFSFIRKMPDKYYDLIVIDPPAFAKTDKAVENAINGYRELNYQAIKKIKNKGIIFTFSCSQKIDNQLFRKIIFTSASAARRNVRILHQLHQAPDHPIDIYQPKSEYLKGLVLLVD